MYNPETKTAKCDECEEETLWENYPQNLLNWECFLHEGKPISICPSCISRIVYDYILKNLSRRREAK